MYIKINRFYQNTNQTMGVCTVFDNDNIPRFSAISLERGWRNNETNISCVPVGEYSLCLEHSNRFKKLLWELKDVPNRSECKFHSSNFWHELNGCIALGSQSLNIGGDKELDVINSKETMTRFEDTLRPMNGKIVKLIVE